MPAGRARSGLITVVLVVMGNGWGWGGRTIAQPPPARPPTAPTPAPVPPRANRVVFNDDWAMAQHGSCGEVRGRFRAIGQGSATDTTLGPVVGARVWLVAPEVIERVHASDTAQLTSIDGRFELRSAPVGVARLKITREGLPDVTVPLDFTSARGYVLDVAVAATNARDERWGATYHIVRPIQGCMPIIPIAQAVLERTKLGRSMGGIVRVLDVAGIGAGRIKASRQKEGASSSSDSVARRSLPPADVTAAEGAALTAVRGSIRDTTTPAPKGGSAPPADARRVEVRRTEPWTRDVVLVTLAVTQKSATEEHRCVVRREAASWVAQCERVVPAPDGDGPGYHQTCQFPPSFAGVRSSSALPRRS